MMKDPSTIPRSYWLWISVRFAFCIILLLWLCLGWKGQWIWYRGGEGREGGRGRREGRGGREGGGEGVEPRVILASLDTSSRTLFVREDVLELVSKLVVHSSITLGSTWPLWVAQPTHRMNVSILHVSHFTWKKIKTSPLFAQCSVTIIWPLCIEGWLIVSVVDRTWTTRANICRRELSISWHLYRMKRLRVSVDNRLDPFLEKSPVLDSISIC